mmetsp:Transcript_29968/g.63889  ORF Transcript_29968/g.63889 Transcript_29968/m.63889 type:complete len:209 (-) Transcript_29968:97-723(-)
MRHIQEDMLRAVHSHLVIDASRDNISRRQIGSRVVPRHEAFALGVPQNRPGAAHRLADQEHAVQRPLLLRIGSGSDVTFLLLPNAAAAAAAAVVDEEGGGVELDELHVLHAGARPRRHGDAVARRHARVGRLRVNLPTAARGNHRALGCESQVRPGVQVHPVASVASDCGRLAHAAIIAALGSGSGLPEDAGGAGAGAGAGGDAMPES